MRTKLKGEEDRLTFPRIGQRITQTAIAVFICLLISYFRGFYGRSMPTESIITAIICMQHFVRDTKEYSINRFSGTLIGSFWGLLFLLLCYFFPQIADHRLLLYAMMAVGVMVSLYGAVVVRMPDAASLAAIVFICIVIFFPEIESPLHEASARILDVLIGTSVAIGVNVFRLPRDKNRDLVFFVRSKDLLPDRFARLPAAAHFKLNYLYNDGAKICLMSEHAPAFFMLQMSGTPLSVPLIVMDGAAIYDANENSYLCAETIPTEASEWLRRWLDELGLSYFLYAIHNDKTCIFHQGSMNEQEKLVYDRMRRSPYRSYLDEENFTPDELVYFKLISSDDRIEQLYRQLQPLLHSRGLCAAVRRQAGAPNVSGLYIYSSAASMRRAREKLMAMLRGKEPDLKEVQLGLRGGYQTEQDALHLLNVLGSQYEPLKILRLFKKDT